MANGWKSTLVQIFSRKVIPKLSTGSFQRLWRILHRRERFVAWWASLRREPAVPKIYGVEDAIALPNGKPGPSPGRNHGAHGVRWICWTFSIWETEVWQTFRRTAPVRMYCFRTGLCMDPDILIMDETRVSSLDPNGRKMVQVSGTAELSADTTVLVDNNLVWSAGIVGSCDRHLDGGLTFLTIFQGWFFKFLHYRRSWELSFQGRRKWKYTGNLSKLPQLELFYTVEEGQKQLESWFLSREFEYAGAGRGKRTVITVHNLRKTAATASMPWSMWTLPVTARR